MVLNMFYYEKSSDILTMRNKFFGSYSSFTSPTQNTYSIFKWPKHILRQNKFINIKLFIIVNAFSTQI